LTGSIDAQHVVMWPIGRIAARDGISKQAVSKKVKGLSADHGLQVDRDTRGRIVAVNVAAYDHLRSKFGDPSKAQSSADYSSDELEPPSGRTGRSPDSFEEAKRQLAWIDAERARMRFAEEKKALVRVAGVVEATTECGQEIARIIDRLPQAADDLAAAIGRDGTHGARVALKRLAQRMREDIAAALATIAGATPEFEEPVPIAGIALEFETEAKA
jgi:biotin operon repressor